MLLLVGIFSCENEDVADFRDLRDADTVALPNLTMGSADFSNYVAIGASFTAGLTDGGLFIAAQENSFPNIIANKFALAGGGDFRQPMMSDNFGGLAAAGTRIIDPRLVFGGAGPVPLESVIGPVTVSTDIVLNNPTGPFNNLGIPGAKSFHLVAPGYGNIAGLNTMPITANPYAVRVTGNSPNATILELATAQNPTFFTISEVGGNDVLDYATSGGSNTDDITSVATFDASLNAIVSGMVATGAKGAIGNIPNITSLPYFTTVGHDVIPLDAAIAAQVNGGYAPYNTGVQLALTSNLISAEEAAARTIVFTQSSNNAVVIEDESLTDLSGFGLPNYRQATASDFIILPASTFIGTAVGGNPLLINGVTVPLADQWVLIPSEQQDIATATASYNATISSTANQYGLALVDFAAILQEASTTGIQYDDYFMNTDLVFGGLISLDGIHLTARGYSFMANAFLQAIDATYGSNFEASGNLARAGDFPTNYSPTLQ